MTRKDYAAIAAALHAEANAEGRSESYRAGVHGAAFALTHYFKVENPNFDPPRFIAAVTKRDMTRHSRPRRKK